MTKRTVGGHAASLAAIVAAAAVAGCSGVGTADDESVDNENAAVTNKGATDPGPRPGAAGAGSKPTPNGDSDDPATIAIAASACSPLIQDPVVKTFCQQAVVRFQEVDSVSGTIAGADGTGLGPTFNANGCAVCHSQPGILGAGVAPSSPQFPGTPNPQVALATANGAHNTLPSFITAAGPIREARFKTDGGVHDLFTIAGRTDAPGCNATQPPFATQLTAGNVTFRIPISTFGDGFIENIPEATLEANLVQSTSAALGITGTFNRSGNDGSITRFGWKAQNKSLLIFALEAYSVEQGISNLGFPNEREGGASNLQGCMAFNPTPEDNNPITAPSGTSESDSLADVFNFGAAMQLSKPATPTTVGIPTAQCDTAVLGSCANAATQGFNMFVNIGCANCHTQQFTTALSSFDDGLSNVAIRPFSDFAIHHMGTGLSDGITQGNAGPDQFRTAPLWGVGQRLFLLHDGRTNDLTTAIAAHASTGSEANAVITAFNNLSASNQQALLVFLRSL